MAEALYLVAHIAGHGIAVSADEVDSVVDLGTIVPVPRAHPAVRGVAALRSRVVTVIDTWHVLGLARPDRATTRAITIRSEGHDYAILVDSVEDVTALRWAPLPRGLAIHAAWGDAARGAVERDGEPLLVVSLAALVPIAASVNPLVTPAGAGSDDRAQFGKHA